MAQTSRVHSGAQSHNHSQCGVALPGVGHAVLVVIGFVRGLFRIDQINEPLFNRGLALNK